MFPTKTYTRECNHCGSTYEGIKSKLYCDSDQCRRERQRERRVRHKNAADTCAKSEPVESLKTRVSVFALEARQANELDLESGAAPAYRAKSLADAEAISGVRNVAINRESCLTGGAAATKQFGSGGIA